MKPLPPLPKGVSMKPMTVVILSTQIRDNEHVNYRWVTATHVHYQGHNLTVTMKSGYRVVYLASEFISFTVEM
ncbi:MAG: hypothetical protein JW395_1216 [Nitrospira sp.]|nr:hypothetical protein [Nitrospira sp.]